MLKGIVGVSNERCAHAGLTADEESLLRLHFTTATLPCSSPKVPIRVRSRNASDTAPFQVTHGTNSHVVPSLEASLTAAPDDGYRAAEPTPG